MALEFNDGNFDKEVLKTDKLALVDFWAEWCGPCISLAPTIELIAKELEGQVVVGKVNVDHNPQVSAEYGITSIPSILFFKGGKLVDKQIGLVSKDMLLNKIKSLS